MKIETHSHTREGSPDGVVGIEKTIEILKEKKYDGMIITGAPVEQMNFEDVI